MVSVAFGDIEPAVGQIAEARRKPEPQQVAEPEHVLGRATGIGIVLPDGEGALMVEQAIQNVAASLPPCSNASKSSSRICDAQVCP